MIKTGKIGCKIFDPVRLAEYRDAVMNRKESLSFERHLADCVYCREALRGLNEDLFHYQSKPRMNLTGFRKKSHESIRVKMTHAGFNLPVPTPGLEIRPVYAAEAAGRVLRLPCALKFVLDSMAVTLTQKGPRAACLSVSLPSRQKKQILEILSSGKILAGAEGRVAVDLDRKGGYEIRSSGRILFALKLS